MIQASLIKTLKLILDEVRFSLESTSVPPFESNLNSLCPSLLLDISPWFEFLADLSFVGHDVASKLGVVMSAGLGGTPINP